MIFNVDNPWIFSIYIYIPDFLWVFVEKTRATVARLIIGKANVPLLQTKDNIPQRLPNVRVDVEMIENAFLVYRFQLSRRTKQPSPFRGGTVSAAKAGRFYRDFYGKFS